MDTGMASLVALHQTLLLGKIAHYADAGLRHASDAISEQGSDCLDLLKLPPVEKGV